MASELTLDHHELELATGKVSYLQGGSGPTLLWLHHSWGNPGALAIHQTLAENFTVVVPDMPGWGGSERPLWARSVRDIAILISQFANQVCADSFTLVGAGMGGYVAAEIACANSNSIKRLVLIGPAGQQPNVGEIKDQMMLSHRQYIEESFLNKENYVQHFGEEPAGDVRELWDHSREMTARVTWKPYMFNRRLGELLKNVGIPTHLIWGTGDTVIPVSVSEQFSASLKNSKTHVIEAAGHLVEIEQPTQVANIIKEASNL